MVDLGGLQSRLKRDRFLALRRDQCSRFVRSDVTCCYADLNDPIQAIVLERSLIALEKFQRSPTRGRLLSLDVFRGIVIAGRILVTDPGAYAHTWHQLPVTQSGMAPPQQT